MIIENPERLGLSLTAPIKRQGWKKRELAITLPSSAW